MHARGSGPREAACSHLQMEGPPEAPVKAAALADRRLRSTQLTSRKSVSQVIGLSASDWSLQATNPGAGGWWLGDHAGGFSKVLELRLAHCPLPGAPSSFCTE